MTCTACRHDNPDGSAFCEQCGTRIEPRCPSCGGACTPGAKFCRGCGAALDGRTDAVGQGSVARKVVTIVFADLIGSTSLHERLDPESVRRVMDRYHRAVRVPVEAHGGTVVQLLGDGVMCAFGVPRVAEDDAIRAVRAAVGMQQAFREYAREHAEVVGKVGLRVAVNTGEVVVSDDYAAGIGDPLNVAARLQQEARDGDVLIGESTERIVRDRVTLEPFGVFHLKGRAESVATYRVVSLERPAGVPATPFVGREDEMRRLLAAYAAAVSERRARLAVVLGSPGLGKSRLIDEVVRRLGAEATVLGAHCDAAGGASLAPIAAALRSLFGDDGVADDVARRSSIERMLSSDESEPARIAAGIAALLDGRPPPPEETFFVVRRLLTSLAASRPVVLAIDDLQWAEPLLLDLTEHLVQWSTGRALFVLVAARPELRDVRAALGAPGPLVSDVVTLGGLDAGAATRLAANVIGAEQLPAALAGRVLAASEGNPLFVGELVRMLVHDGALKREGDRWTAATDLADLEMPPTIQALLAARIERLHPEERIVLERAAVVGRHFSRGAVAELLPREVTDLDARFESLRRGEIIEPAGGTLLGEPALRFHHVLIRDAAYRRLLKETRAELHGRLADWIVARAADSGEQDETIGWHLEQAHQNLRELGPLDASGRAFGERAARHLASAGRRALARDDLPLAASLLGRAIDRLDPSDPARADLAPDWCESLLAAGDVAPAVDAIAELARWIESSPRSPTPDPRLRAWHACFAGQLAVLTDPQALRATVDAVAAAAQSLSSEGDAAGEAKAHSVHALALARLGEMGACEAALDRALAAARRAGDRRRANAVLAGAPVAALWGPSPVTRASGRCLDVVRVLRITQGAPAVEAVALRCQAVLEALRGRTDAARRMTATSRKMVEDLGITQQLLETDAFSGLIELLDGNAPAAERCLRAAYDGLRAHGLAIDAARAASLLARAVLAQDRAAEAETLSHESELLAGDDLKAAIAWRGVRAEALAARGETATAIDLARAAVEIAAATDALLDHADARFALATALRAAARQDEGASEAERSIELWEAKGATLLVDRVRRLAWLAGRPVHPGEVKRARSPVRRRVRVNAAIDAQRGFDAAIRARDLDAVAGLVADDIEVVHHPNGATIRREGGLERFRLLFRTENLAVSAEPLATLGERLALGRDVTSFTGFTDGQLEFGESRSSYLNLVEVDERGRAARIEIFAENRLGQALSRLYDRHAALLPEGPQGARATATARSVALLLGPFDLEQYAKGIAPTAEFVDRRMLGFPSGQGVHEMLRSLGTLLETADDVATRVDDVIAACPDALLVRWTTTGTDRVSRGPFEWQFLRLVVFGPDGLLARVEQFDVDDVDAALARYDELAGEPTPAPFANAAALAVANMERSWDARDWDRMVASFAPEFRMDDRRALVGLPLSGSDFLANLRMMFEVPASRWQNELRGTRGERLALFHCRFSGGHAGRALVEFEHLSLVEVDAEQRYAALVVFDPVDLAAAHAELDERFAASDATSKRRAALTRAFCHAFADRDWDALGALLAPDLVVTDHRVLGWETLHGAAEYVGTLRSLVELAPDVELRVDHLTMSGSRFLYVTTWCGTRDGGAFESPSAIVCELDEMARIRRFDQFDLAQLAEARALLSGDGAALRD